MKKEKRVNRGLIVFVVIGWMLTLLLGGCSSSSNDSAKSNGESMANKSAMDQSLAEAPQAVAGNALQKLEDDLAVSTGDVNGSSTLNPTPDVLGFNQKIIYHANLTMEVTSYNKAQTQVKNLIHLAGGYILQFSDSKTTNEQGGLYVIKVPSKGFMPFISELEKLKPVDLQRSLDGKDVTEEYVDLDSRLKAKQVVETRLLSFMEKATKASDLVSFSSELGKVQEEIERIKGRLRYLDQNVAFSTIELRMYQNLDGVSTLKKEESMWTRAGQAMKESSQAVFNFLEGLLVFAAGMIPILIIMVPFAAIAWYLYQQHKKKSNNQEHKVDE